MPGIRSIGYVAAAAATAASCLVYAASSSSATEQTVPGCFGAATAIVCDVTVEVTSPVAVGTTEILVPVCVGTCTDVPVTVVEADVDWPGEICVSYSNRNGVEQQRICRPIEPQPVPTVTVPPLPRPTVPPLPTVNPSPVVSTASRAASQAARELDEISETLGEEVQPILERIIEIVREGCDINQRPICG